MPKKGRTQRRTGRSGAPKELSPEMERLAASKPDFFLETIGGDGSLQKEIDRQWRGTVSMIGSDLKRIRAVASANIPDRDRRSLRQRVREIEVEVDRAGVLLGLLLERLGAIETGFRYARCIHEAADTIPRPSKKKGRSRAAATSTRKSQ